MLGENIKILRKRRGYSQETLAQQLNVVRQTVSKWEKGISVPDADMLTRLAELFEVTVGELLGENIENKADAINMNEVAVQLEVLNEQLANQSRRRRKIVKGIMLGILIIVVLAIAVYIIAFVAFMPRYTQYTVDETMTTELLCTLDGQEYIYEITYDDQYRIISAGGDAFIADHVQTENYDDANVLVAQIEDYFMERGGTCERVDQTPK